MDYLTNYYKNLCEQLQEKLNILEAQINEGRYNPETGKVERFRDDMGQTTDKLERKPSTKDQPIVPEPKPEEKDKIKNFIRLMRDGAKPGEKIKKTPSKTIYRDEEELPYIE